MTSKDPDIAIIGTGFSGIAMAVKLMDAGFEDFTILERASEVGGTWRDNAYPGCACDVPSHLYSFSFAPNPHWSQTFSPQAEIWAYLRKVADDFGVTPHVSFDTRVDDAAWDDDEGRWSIETSQGTFSARVLVSAQGALSDPSLPDVPGLKDFPGAVFHSATWDHDHNLEDERVAVIGTGASSIQFVPQIQPKVGQLHLFQRTPPWIMPRRQRPVTKAERAVYRAVPRAQQLMRDAIYWAREAFALPMIRVQLAPIVKKLATAHLHRQVADPELREKLTPDFLPGCKRILVSNDYLPSLTRENVEVLTEGIQEVRGNTVIGTDGSEREVDTIILGTGFHVTDMPLTHHIRGQDGRTLAEHWEGSPQAYHGSAIAGFPNLFFLLGPNTGLGHTSVVVMVEAQADYVVEGLKHMRAQGTHALAVRPEVQEAWNRDIQKAMRGTVWTQGGCSSWYLDAKGLNTTLWPNFTVPFRRRLKTFDPPSYATWRPAAPGAAAAAEAETQVPA